jgi:hypothetical protein
VLVYETFSEVEVEWITHDGCALVVDIESIPSSSCGHEGSSAYRLVTVLVDGKLVDDYYENELTPL